MKTSEEGFSQSDVELGRVSRERNPHRSTQLTNCPAGLPLTSRVTPSSSSSVSLIRSHFRGSQVNSVEFCHALSYAAFSASIAFCRAQKMLWLPIDSGVYWSTVIRIDEPFLLCYSEADIESDGLKLVLFAHTFVTCFTARFFLTRYGIDMQCVTKVLRSNYRIRKIDKENHESSLEFIILRQRIFRR